MKIALTCVLAYLGLALASNYKVKIKNDGSSILGGSIHFVAEVKDDGVTAAGPFKYEWEDNTPNHNRAIHDSNSYKNDWTVLYNTEDGSVPGSYITTLTVKKSIGATYLPIANATSSFSITRHLHGAFLVSTEAFDTDYLVTHKVVLTTPNANFLKDKGASVVTYWYVDGVYYGATNGLTFTMKYPKLYRRIGVQALVVAQLHDQSGHNLVENSNTVYTYVDNLLFHPIINHYTTCNASFPYTTTNNNVKVNKNTLLGCFTRTFRLWESLIGGPWSQPSITSGSLYGISLARDKILNSQNQELEYITDPFVKTIVSDRIENINQRIPILAKSNPFDYSTVEARIQSLKEEQKSALENIKDPYVKSLVKQRIDEKNKYIPRLTRPNIHNAVDGINRGIDNIQRREDIALHYVRNPIARAAIKNRMDAAKNRLSIKAAALDSRFKESYNNRMEEISKQLETKPVKDKVDRKQKEKLRSSKINKPTIKDVNEGIKDLRNAENMVLERIDDPIIKSIVLDRIHEQNKRIPTLLKSNVPKSEISEVLEDIHTKIDDEIKRSTDISLDDVKDPATKEVILNGIKERNQILIEKSKEVDEDLKVPLSEIRERIKELKETEETAIENETDPDVKEEVINTIDKENEKIPVLMLPMVMGKNFSFVLDLIRGKMDNLVNNEAMMTQNVTNPLIQALVASKFDRVNYILNTKFKMLSDSFGNILNTITASVDETNAETQKTPVLTKTLNPKADDLEFPASLATNFSEALDSINTRINDLKDTAIKVTQNITIPAIQELVAFKLANVNTILNEKYKELSDNFTSIIDNIKEKLANATLDSSKKSLKKSKKVPKLGISLGSETEDDDSLTNELITNYTIALDTLRTRINDLQNVQNVIGLNFTNPFAQVLVASKFNAVNFILNAKYKQLSDNFTNFLNTISAETGKPKNVPKLSLSSSSDQDDLSFPGSLSNNFSLALDSFKTRINNLKDNTTKITQNITIPAIQELVAFKLDQVNAILNEKYKQLSDNFTTIIDTIKEKLANASLDASKKSWSKSKKVPKLGMPLDSDTDDDDSLTNELITNYTMALDELQTKIDDLQNVQDVITQNITNPFAQAIVTSKLNTVNFILNTKYKQLSDNFTNFLNSLSSETESPRKVPKLSLSSSSDIQDLSLPESLASNFSVALDAINTRLNDLKDTTDLLSQNITDPAVQALVSSKLEKVSTILSTKYQELSNNFTNIIDIINSKLTNASASISNKSPKKSKKVPKLGKSLDDNSEYLSDTTDVITNFTIALDAIRTRIDDLKNAETNITQGIINPFAQAIVASKLDRINFILKTKYQQLNDNFTNVMDTINSRLQDASTDKSVTGARKVPKLTKAFDFGTNFSTIIETIKTKITGKKTSTDAVIKYIKNPAIQELVMNKIIEENKNLSTIADNVEANLTAALDDYNKKAKDLNTLEDFAVDYIDEPSLQAVIINEIEEANKEIPLLSVSKRNILPEQEESVQYTPPQSFFKMKYPTVIRF